MELYDEVKKEPKSKKNIWIVALVVLIILLFLILGIMYKIKSEIKTISYEGLRNLSLEQIVQEKEINGEDVLCFPIKEVAPILGYKEVFTGGFPQRSEDPTKCHAIRDEEVILFSKDSKQVSKILKNKKNKVEKIDIEYPIFFENDKLYIALNDMSKVFNIYISSDESEKNINIFAMQTLIETYISRYVKDSQMPSYANQKAILDNFLIMTKNDKYGVIDITTLGNNINYLLEPKYEEISYIREIKSFKVKSNGKFGIIGQDAKIKIKIEYDEIIPIDFEKDLYKVGISGLYGVINSKGQQIIPNEYSEIGILENDFTENNFQNSMLLANRLIPVKNIDGYWSFYDIDNNFMREFIYNQIGCTEIPVKNGYSTVLIEDYNTIVVRIGEFYNLIQLDGKELLPRGKVNSIYFKIDSITNNKEFFMTTEKNTKLMSVNKYLENMGIKKGKVEE